MHLPLLGRILRLHNAPETESEDDPLMKRSEDRILTTHVGSLARPPELAKMLDARAAGRLQDIATFDAECQKAVTAIVRQQAEAGISIINDGEQSKDNFATYVKQRLSGFGDKEEVPMPITLDERDFPRYRFEFLLTPCVGPVEWQDFSSVEKDIAHLTEAVKGVDIEEAFMTAVSPGTVVNFFPNRYYGTREEYLAAVGEVLKREYDAIVAAGFILQVDCPDLALQNYWFPDTSEEEFRAIVSGNIEILNHALRDVPVDRVRMHVCWGAMETPRNHDVPLRLIVDLLLRAKVSGLSFMAANGAHEHEWRVWEDVKLPDHMSIIPGIIDNTTNVIEHPEVVAERIQRYARVVGRERVIAGVDCGFGTIIEIMTLIDPKIAMAKLAMLSEGAALASARLWP
jgi:5-methyltetrahydropteroyltriglutamate--homocysteine methyltransferase